MGILASVALVQHQRQAPGMSLCQDSTWGQMRNGQIMGRELLRERVLLKIVIAADADILAGTGMTVHIGLNHLPATIVVATSQESLLWFR